MLKSETVNLDVKQTIGIDLKWQKAVDAAKSFFEQIQCLAKGAKTIKSHLYDGIFMGKFASKINVKKAESLNGTISLVSAFDEPAIFLETRLKQSGKEEKLEVLFNQFGVIIHAAT